MPWNRSEYNGIPGYLSENHGTSLKISWLTGILVSWIVGIPLSGNITPTRIIKNLGIGI